MGSCTRVSHDERARRRPPLAKPCNMFKVEDVLASALEKRPAIPTQDAVEQQRALDEMFAFACLRLVGLSQHLHRVELRALSDLRT